MLWVGVPILTLGVIVSAFKGLVVWHSTHELCDGGVPTADFFLFCPIPLAGGITLVLYGLDLYPFPGFGVAVYVGLAACFGLLHWWFDRAGTPERQRQLAESQKQFPTKEK